MIKKAIKKDRKELLYQKSNLRIFILGLSLLISGSWLAILMVQHFFNVPPASNAQILPNLFWTIGSLTWIPIIEEMIFREYLNSFLQKNFSWKTSAGISSFIFAILHGQKNLVPFFLNGIVYSWSKHKSGTIIMPIMLHICYNFVALITQIIL